MPCTTSVNRGCCSHQAVAAAAAPAPPPPPASHPEGLQGIPDGQKQDTGLDAKVQAKGMLPKNPDSYIFLYTEKC